jgi:hypothetical protein
VVHDSEQNNIYFREDSVSFVKQKPLSQARKSEFNRSTEVNQTFVNQSVPLSMCFKTGHVDSSILWFTEVRFTSLDQYKPHSDGPLATSILTKTLLNALDF